MKTALSAKIGKKIKEKRLELKLTILEISNEINYLIFQGLLA